MMICLRIKISWEPGSQVHRHYLTLDLNLSPAKLLFGHAFRDMLPVWPGQYTPAETCKNCREQRELAPRPDACLSRSPATCNKWPWSSTNSRWWAWTWWPSRCPWTRRCLRCPSLPITEKPVKKRMGFFIATSDATTIRQPANMYEFPLLEEAQEKGNHRRCSPVKTMSYHHAACKNLQVRRVLSVQGGPQGGVEVNRDKSVVYQSAYR